ncbi:MAG: ABC transporter permease, partial [Anaerolineae bacterium]|nr:ABC transporter permease [Anaerolineae bacterium]
MLNRLSTYLYQRPKLVLGLLLGPPLIYFLVVYIGSLLALLVNSFFRLEEFTGLVVREFTLEQYAKLFTSTNLGIFGRTAGMAIAVTIADGIIAFPLAYYIARFASPRMKTYLYIAVTIPLWSSYLVRVYAWKLILAKEGIVSWFFNLFGLQFVLDGILSIPGIGGSSLSLSPIGMFITFCYIWLPYMIVPIQTALERVP